MVMGKLVAQHLIQLSEIGNPTDCTVFLGDNEGRIGVFHCSYWFKNVLFDQRLTFLFENVYVRLRNRKGFAMHGVRIFV
jgi:hypothetical protein